MKKQIFIIIASVLIGIIGGFISLDLDFAPENFETIISSGTTWLIAIVSYFVILIFLLLSIKPKSDNHKGGGHDGKTKTGEKINEFADSRWVTENELRTEKRFGYYKFSELGNCKKDGILIRSELDEKKKDIHMNLYTKDYHTLIIGASGSGKTEGYVFPSLQAWTKCASKPSIFVSDPKGELYGKTSYTAQKNGYNILSIDLRNPYASKRWNPMSQAYKLYHRSLNLEKEVKKIIGIAPDPHKYQIMNEKYGNEWFSFNGVAYPNETTLKQDILATRSELKTKAERSLTDFSQAVCPIQNQHDRSWEEGAQKFIEGIANAMLEDSADPNSGMTEEKFCPYNLAQIICHKDTEGEDNFASIKEYVSNRPRDSKVMGLCATALFNAPGTTKSFMGVATNAMALFQDAGICYLTSGTEIDMSRFPYDPTIVYFIVPDEDKTRHGLATMFISQLYKSLIDEAVKCNPHEPSLPKRVYFMLDEFANIPKIPDFAQLITVGRSRKIFFSLIVQSYSQLDGAYGQQDASTIRENCNIKIYIGTDDQQTRESFSKLCGNISIELENKSKNVDKDGKESGTSKSVTTKERPLIFPDELGHVRESGDYCIVKIFNEYPMKNVFSMHWKCVNAGVFTAKFMDTPYAPKTFFDTNKYYFDFKKRWGRSGSSSNLFDF